MATLGAIAAAPDLGGMGYSAMVGRKSFAVIACRSDHCCRNDHFKGRSKRTSDHGRLEQASRSPTSSGQD